MGFIACGGASSEQTPAASATAAPIDPAKCKCRDWETVDFSFQDMSTGEWCRGGRECAKRYNLKANECANPGDFEKKKWCYVPDGCGGNVSVIAGLFWKNCD